MHIELQINENKVAFFLVYLNSLKLLYMGIKNAEKKWSMPIWNWSLTLSQLDIFFEGRLDNALNL